MNRPHYPLVCVKTGSVAGHAAAPIGLCEMRVGAELTRQLQPLVYAVGDASDGLNLTLYWLAHRRPKSEVMAR